MVLRHRKVITTTLMVLLMLFTSAGCTRQTEHTGSDTSQDPAVGVFDYENHTVLLNSGYTMPILGLGTYSLDHDTCVNSVMALLENGGRLIDTAYMYHNEEAVGEGVRRAMEEYHIPQEDIFVITKIYPNQFSDPALGSAEGHRGHPRLFQSRAYQRKPRPVRI